MPFNLRFFPWNQLQRSNYTLGLHQRDRRLPARTRVLGIERIGGDLVYLKDEVAKRGWIRNDEVRLLIGMIGECASGFLAEADGQPREFIVQDSRIVDKDTGSIWDFRGRGLAGPLIEYNLITWPISDQFWFAWSEHHRLSRIVHVGEA